MDECVINGQAIELLADVQTMPRVDDPAAPSPLMKFPQPGQTCEKYRPFLEAADAFIREELRRLGIADARLWKAEQHIPGQTWSFYYGGVQGAQGDYVPVLLSGVSETEVPSGAVLTMDKYGTVEIRPG